MIEDVVDGVPVLVGEAPPPFRAGLVFGVGRRDETFVQGGLTHLVEHLVMSRVGRTALPVNASVDLSTTEFTAAGSPEAVADHLRTVCLALSDLPLDRLAVEAGVLQAEDGQVAPPAVAALLGEVYGGTGAGLAAFGEPAVGALTGEDVLAWARRWFVRGNAVLWSSAPLPPGLSLPLPAGEAPPRVPQQVRAVATPALTHLPDPGRVALGGHVPRLPGLTVALRVLRDRVEDQLRHRRGLTYHVDADQLSVDPDRVFAHVTADVRLGHEGTAAAVLWQALVRLADEGPTDDELAHQRALVAAFLADPESAVGELRAAAAAAVTGTARPTREEMRASAADARREDVRAAAAALRERALLGVPEADALDLPGLPLLPAPPQDAVEGRVFRPRLWSPAPRRSRLVVGEAGVSLLLPEGPVTVRYDDAIGLLETAPDAHQLVRVDGTAVPLEAGHWRDGDAALALVRAALPPALQARAAGAEAGPGVLLLSAPPHRAREALSFAGTSGAVLTRGSWTAVVPDDPAEVAAAALSEQLGRRGSVLLLHERHGDLTYVLFRGGQEQDRHVWSGPQGDPRLLAEATGRPESETAALLAADGEVEELVARAVAALGLPPEVARLLAGEEVPAAQRVEGGGFREGMRASLRGDFDRPDSWMARYRSWERRRAPSYRAYSAAWVAGSAGAVWWLLQDGLEGWRVALAAVAAVLGLTSLWYGVTPTRE